MKTGVPGGVRLYGIGLEMSLKRRVAWERRLLLENVYEDMLTHCIGTTGKAEIKKMNIVIVPSSSLTSSPQISCKTWIILKNSLKQLKGESLTDNEHSPVTLPGQGTHLDKGNHLHGNGQRSE